MCILSNIHNVCSNTSTVSRTEQRTINHSSCICAVCRLYVCDERSFEVEMSLLIRIQYCYYCYYYHYTVHPICTALTEGSILFCILCVYIHVYNMCICCGGDLYEARTNNRIDKSVYVLDDQVS